MIARQNLANQFRLLGDVETAARHVARAVAVADESRQPLTIARAGLLEAIHALSTGGDVGRAHRVLAHADRLTPPTAPIGLRRTILFNLASANLSLGGAEDALGASWPQNPVVGACATNRAGRGVRNDCDVV